MARVYITEKQDCTEIEFTFLNNKTVKANTNELGVTHWGYNLSGLIACCSSIGRYDSIRLPGEIVDYYYQNKAAEDKHYFEILIESNNAQMALMREENIQYLAMIEMD